VMMMISLQSRVNIIAKVVSKGERDMCIFSPPLKLQSCCCCFVLLLHRVRPKYGYPVSTNATPH
jgi:hypothetical protein